MHVLSSPGREESPRKKILSLFLALRSKSSGVLPKRHLAPPIMCPANAALQLLPEIPLK